jgi:hypothetical protein
VPRAPGLAWDWPAAALGGAYALPAAVVTLNDPQRGFALAVGVLPAAIVGVLPTRRARLAIVVLGACIGVPIFLGGVLSGVPVLAVAAILGLGVGSAQLAGRFRFGTLAMNLSLPMAGVGLSYSAGKAAGAAALIVVGSACACAISMLLPEQRAPAAPPARRPPAAAPTLDYGIRLGAAGATAAAIGFVLDLDHVGWACAAALLVMRPAAEMQRLRSVGRIVSVFLGAVAAVALVHAGPPAAVYSLAVLAALAGVAGVHASRWYVVPAFTTFLVFLLLLYSHPQDAASRFGERVLETLLGVSIAYLFGLVLPALMRQPK